MRKRVGVEQKLSISRQIPQFFLRPVSTYCMLEKVTLDLQVPLYVHCVHCVECCVLWRVHVHDVSALLKRWCSTYGLKRTIGKKCLLWTRIHLFKFNSGHLLGRKCWPCQERYPGYQGWIPGKSTEEPSLLHLVLSGPWCQTGWQDRHIAGSLYSQKHFV